MLGVTPEQLEARDHRIEVNDFPQRSLAIGQVAPSAGGTREPPIGSASYNPPTVPHGPRNGPGQTLRHLRLCDPDRRSGRGHRYRRSGSDPDRRRPRLRHSPSIRRWWKARSRAAARWESDSRCRRRSCSTSKGLGMIYANLTNYIMPTSLDMPEIEVHIVPSHDSKRAVRRQGRGRADLGADRGGDFERHPRCRGGEDHLAAGHRREGAGGDQGEARGRQAADRGAVGRLSFPSAEADRARYAPPRARAARPCAPRPSGSRSMPRSRG